MGARTARRRRAKKYLRNPWGPPPGAREQWRADRHYERERAWLIAQGLMCARCGYPWEMPHCPHCPAFVSGDAEPED
ncbi:hypothetical protein [Saccharothrix sp. ALI-22-I]|uniref:hypothetical protein n=1 Tax=Saccharothrix sp. ALI-22-I TaxID=1933778 RepID=UPI0015C2FE27|nr:hypothetical protein [Saccharothrix sp. ALI-22-I]